MEAVATIIPANDNNGNMTKKKCFHKKKLYYYFTNKSFFHFFTFVCWFFFLCYLFIFHHNFACQQHHPSSQKLLKIEISRRIETVKVENTRQNSFHNACESVCAYEYECLFVDCSQYLLYIYLFF